LIKKRNCIHNRWRRKRTVRFHAQVIDISIISHLLRNKMLSYRRETALQGVL